MLTSVWIFPIAVAFLLPFTFIVTYFIAVWHKHAQAVVPFISDGGSFPPESCIFAQSLNFCSLLIGIVMYVRHRQIAEFHRYSQKSMGKLLRCSTIFLWIGYMSAFGVSMVGNFQQSNWLMLHMVGALLAFGLGLVYSWAQTVFSYLMKPVLHDRFISHIRLALSILSTLCFFLMMVYGFESFVVMAHGFVPTEKTNKFQDRVLYGCGEPLIVLPSEAEYSDHVITTSCEWLVSIFFVLNLMTYAVELRHATLEPPKLTLTDIEKTDLPIDVSQLAKVSFYIPSNK